MDGEISDLSWHFSELSIFLSSPGYHGHPQGTSGLCCLSERWGGPGGESQNHRKL